jgi:hypothetical protein
MQSSWDKIILRSNECASFWFILIFIATSQENVENAVSYDVSIT